MMKKYALLIVIALAVGGGVFAVMKPASTDNRTTASRPQDTSFASPLGPAGAPDPNIGISVPNDQHNDVVIVVQGGRRSAGPEIVHARQGEIVTFHVTSDVSDDFVLRGYETQVQLFKGAAATLIVKANRVGEFPYALQRSGMSLGMLEVAAP
jgi:heme/copper-type cytochrome/quinol oxidase subunit 2